MPGPVPKRSDVRRRRNSTGTVDRIAHEPVTPPPLSDEVRHPLVRDWYTSLGESPQAIEYAASDYLTAQLVALTIDEAIFRGGLSANMLASFLTACTSLLATAGDRRRLRLEFQRASGDEEADDGDADVLAFYRGASSS